MSQGSEFLSLQKFWKRFSPVNRVSPPRTSQDGSSMNVDPENRIITEGFLYKTTTNFLRSCQKRWFQVRNNQLVYLNKSKEARVVIEDLRLCTIESTVSTGQRRLYCFKVVSPTKSYILAADFEETRLAWTRAIENIALVNQPTPENLEEIGLDTEKRNTDTNVLVRTSSTCQDLESKRTETPLVQTISSPSNGCFLDKYVLDEVLGGGIFGRFNAGVCMADGREVAIKYVHKQPTDRYITIPGEAEPRPAEVALMYMVSQASHSDNIIELLEWFDHPEYYVLALEKPSPCMYLVTYLKEGPLSEDVAQIIIVQVIQAVLHCIAWDVLYRDIKMENIVVNPDDLRVKLVDFGCADLYKTTLYNEFEGTWFNMPPECFLHSQYFRCAAIVWSLGILLYNILCGPLSFEDYIEVIRENLHFRRGLTRECRHLIRSCLAKTPENRLNLCEILAHKWFKFQK